MSAPMDDFTRAHFDAWFDYEFGYPLSDWDDEFRAEMLAEYDRDSEHWQSAGWQKLRDWCSGLREQKAQAH